MGLKFKTATARELADAFRAASTDAKTAGMTELGHQTEIMKDLSVKQAPVDEGDLEGAHRIVRRANGSDKVSYDIVVGGNGVDAYASVIHDLFGVRWFKLGPKSLAKQAGQPEIVGEKFLERAFTARAEKLLTAVTNAVLGGIKRHVG